MASQSRRSPTALVLGGYGAVGRHAAGVLADAGVRVQIGGRRHTAAEQAAAALSSAAPVVVDAGSPHRCSTPPRRSMSSSTAPGWGP